MIRVLVANDNFLVRRTFVAVLKSKDIVVVGEAGNGEQAIEKAGQLHPDVIVMDVAMPGLDGMRAAERLTGMGHPARILMVSTQSQAGNARAAARIGAAGYFVLGGSREELIEAVHTVSEGKKYASPQVASLFYDHDPH